MKTHSDASNIFSFEALRECNEIIRLVASKIKKLDSNNDLLSRISGKNSRNKKKSKTVYTLSLLNPFFFTIKLVINIETNKAATSTPLETMFIQELSPVTCLI